MKSVRKITTNEHTTERVSRMPRTTLFAKIGDRFNKHDSSFFWFDQAPHRIIPSHLS